MSRIFFTVGWKFFHGSSRRVICNSCWTLIIDGYKMLQAERHEITLMSFDEAKREKNHIREIKNLFAVHCERNSSNAWVSILFVHSNERSRWWCLMSNEMCESVIPIIIHSFCVFFFLLLEQFSSMSSHRITTFPRVQCVSWFKVSVPLFPLFLHHDSCLIISRKPEINCFHLV